MRVCLCVYMSFLYFFLGSFFFSVCFVPFWCFFLLLPVRFLLREREIERMWARMGLWFKNHYHNIPYEKNIYSIRIKIINKEKNHFGEFGMEKLKNSKISASTFYSLCIFLLLGYEVFLVFSHVFLNLVDFLLMYKFQPTEEHTHLQ